MKLSPRRLSWLRRLCTTALLFSFSGLRAAEAAAPTAASATPTPTAASASTADTKPNIPTIFVCGDSTANSGGRIQGWGTPIANYFDPAKVTIANVAQAGTSSRTFYNGNWPRIISRVKSGDYVLIVFGINDGLGALTGTSAGRSSLNGLGDETQNVDGRNGQVEAVHTYGWYMAKMATEAQAKGAHVYLLTVTARNIWTNPKATFNDAAILTQEEGYDAKDDKIERGTGKGQYTQWTKDVGVKLHLPVLDLTNLEGDRHEKMGREKVTLLYQDHNHTFPPGAELVASYVVSGLKAFKNSPFTALLSEKGKALETADVKYVIENSADRKSTDSKLSDAKPATPAASAK